MRRRSRRGRPNPVEIPILLWLLSGIAGGTASAIVYTASGAAKKKTAVVSTKAPSSNESSAASGPPPGSKANPLQVSADQLFGPKDAWAVMLIGGMDVLGQYSKPLTVLGETTYQFVKVSETPSAALIAQEQAAAQAAANAASASAASAALAAQATTPTPLPPGNFKYSLALAAGATVQIQLDVGDTVALSFPDQLCGANWTAIIPINPSPVSINPPNVMTAVSTGQVQITFSCSASKSTTTVDVNVIAPGAVVLQSP